MSETMDQSEVRALLRGEPVPTKRKARTVTRLVLELPHPGNACSPNARCHWSAKAKAVKVMREAAATMAAYELRKLNAKPPLWGLATVQATFHRPGKRSKLADADNCIASLKGAIDGLQDSGVIINDRALTHLPPQQVIGDAAGERKLVLVLTPVA